nr:helix-turn-helix transcriptional regulator [Terribacillus saccharophilus]
MHFDFKRLFNKKSVTKKQNIDLFSTWCYYSLKEMIKIVVEGTHPGTLIREKRKALGITQSELADICGIHRSSIVKIEKGEPIIQDDWFERIGSALKYPPEKLKNSYKSYFRQSDHPFIPFSFSLSFDEAFSYLIEDAKHDWISDFINRTDGDYDIFKSIQPMLSTYRNGRIIIERFQIAIHLLCEALENNDVIYSIKHIRLSSFKLDQMLNNWKRYKNSSEITFKKMYDYYTEVLSEVDKNYAEYLKELLKKSTVYYRLSSTASHAYEIGESSTRKIEEYMNSELENFIYYIERLYVATDFIMNILNRVSLYDIIEDYKISEYLKLQSPENLFDYS